MRRIPNRIEEHMSAHPCLVSRKIPIGEAATFMREMGFRHLPVTEDGKVVGVVSERDLHLAKVFATMNVLIEDVMAHDPYCVKVGTPLSVVAAAMADKKIGSAVVLNHEGTVVGIFTTTDAMNILGSMPTERGIEEYLTGNFLI